VEEAQHGGQVTAPAGRVVEVVGRAPPPGLEKGHRAQEELAPEPDGEGGEAGQAVDDVAAGEVPGVLAALLVGVVHGGRKDEGRGVAAA